jgi:hypothetical protein
VPRFVLLHHALPDSPPHFDLMLERGDALATWRIPAPLRDLPPEGAAAVPLGDHRLHYLTYEGDIGGGRGTVTRVDEGTYTAEAWEAERVTVTLKGRSAAGRLELSPPVGEGPWRVKYDAV